MVFLGIGVGVDGLNIVKIYVSGKLKKLSIIKD